MSEPTLRYLSRQDVESLIVPMPEIITAVEAAIREKGEGTAEMPPKPGVHPRPDAFIHAMPAFLEMDLVVTSGPILKAPSPVIPAGWLEAGSFACPLDFDSYWTGEAFRQVDKLAIEDVATARLIYRKALETGAGVELVL